MSSLSFGIRRLLPRNAFARSVSILAGGTAGGQFIVALSSPLLTRLYGPDDFGLLAAFIAALAILVVVASLRYQFAIPLPADELEAAHIVVLCLGLVTMISLASAAVVWLFGPAVASLLNLPALAGYLWLLPIALLMAGAYEVFSYWAVRTKAFPAIARTRLAQAISMTIVQLGGFMLGPLALLTGHAAGNAAGTFGLGSLALRRRWAVFRQVRLAGVLAAAKRYRRFPLFSTWGGAFNTLSTQVPPLLFAAFFSPAIAGLYALAQRVLAMPMSLVGEAVGDVFFSDAAEARRAGTIAPLVAGIHDKLAQIAMPPALILLLIGPELFGLVFGEDWRQAGQFAQWMSPWLYLQFVSSPLSMTFDVLEKQAQEMLFQAGLLTIRILALLAGAWVGDVAHAVAFFALGSALSYLALLCWIFVLAGCRLSELWQPTARALLWSGLLASPLALAVVMSAPFAQLLAAFALVTGLLAARYLFLLRAAW